MDDLKQAIKHAQEAFNATPLDHPDRAVYLNSLGLWLSDRYSHTENVNDLEQAIAYAHEVVRITPHNDSAVASQRSLRAVCSRASRRTLRLSKTLAVPRLSHRKLL